MDNNKVNIEITLDKTIEANAAELLASMGLDHTSAIDMYYRHIIEEKALPFAFQSAQTFEEKIIEAALKRNPKRVKLQTNEKGHIVIDKEQHPEIYEWAKNG